MSRLLRMELTGNFYIPLTLLVMDRRFLQAAPAQLYHR